MRRPSLLVLVALAVVSAGFGGAERREKPDLVVTKISNPPLVRKAAASFHVRGVVENVGRGGAANTTTAYFLSGDRTKSKRDVLLLGRSRVRALEPAPATDDGVRLTGSAAPPLKVTIPKATRAGFYYVIACADARGSLDEARETNNCLASRKQMEVISSGGASPPGDDSPPEDPNGEFGYLRSASVSGRTVYYRVGASGGFALHLSARDPESGIAHATFPLLGPGWVGGGVDVTPPFSTDYAFGPATAEPGTVGATATNGAGLTSPPFSFTVRGDGATPTTSATCNGGPCSSEPYNGAVSVALAATDSGSGVDVVVYTTDGVDPTRAHGGVYVAPLLVTETTTVKFRAYDRVGNAEQVRSVTVVVE